MAGIKYLGFKQTGPDGDVFEVRPVGAELRLYRQQLRRLMLGHPQISQAKNVWQETLLPF